IVADSHPSGAWSCVTSLPLSSTQTRRTPMPAALFCRGFEDPSVKMFTASSSMMPLPESETVACFFTSLSGTQSAPHKWLVRSPPSLVVPPEVGHEVLKPTDGRHHA